MSNYTVTSRDFYASGTVETHTMDLTEYHVDMAWCRKRGENVRHWDGEDRNGKPLHVAWVTEPHFGRSTLYAYEVQESTPEGPAHADYPHEPGRLYDCPACEAECHCVMEEEPCVYCASL